MPFMSHRIFKDSELKKYLQWSEKETNYLLAIWTSTDFQLKLDSGSPDAH